MMFGFNPFEELGDVETVIFEVYVGNQCVQRQQMQAPMVMLEAQFKQAMQEIAGQKGKQPMTIKMSRNITIHDQFTNEDKVIPSWIMFSNYDKEDAT